MSFLIRSLGLLLAALVVPYAAAAQAGSTATSAGALIRPGDQVTVKIFREPELSGAFAVSDMGEVVLPRLGRMRVTELSPHALQDSLAQAYGEYLRTPSIEVTVLRRIGVQGEVRRPDTYMVDLTVTLRDLISHAGGVTAEGNPSKIMIVRGGERIELDEGASSRFSAAELESGDQVIVGRRNWMALNPAVAAGTAMSVVSFLIGLMTILHK